MRRCAKRAALVLLAVSLLALALFAALTLAFPGKTTSFVAPSRPILLFAHRGDTTQAPENTMEAVAAARAKGFAGVEIDIRGTSDGKAVLFHDDNLLRMLGSEAETGETPYAGISALPVLRDGQPTASRVPLLGDVFSRFPDLYYYVDVKTPGSRFLRTLVEIIRGHGMEQRVIVGHANFVQQVRWKLLYPELANALEGFNAGSERWLPFLPERLRPDFYSSFIFNIDREQIDYLARHQLLDRRIAYTVTRETYDQALSYGLRYLIVDIDAPPLPSR